MGVGGRLPDLPVATGGEDHGLRPEDVDLAGRQFVGDRASGDRLAGVFIQDDVEHVELVEELHALLDAVLVEGLQDHVAGAVGRVARTANGGLTVVARMTAEPTLVDAPLRRPVERQTHLLQIQDSIDCFLAHDLGRVLVDQVIAALDGVEGVPLPVVFLDVSEGCAHTALRRACVRARRVELGQHRCLCSGARLQGGTHTGAPGADDDDVEDVGLHGAVIPPANRCSGRR